MTSRVFAFTIDEGVDLRSPLRFASFPLRHQSLPIERTALYVPSPEFPMYHCPLLFCCHQRIRRCLIQNYFLRHLRHFASLCDCLAFPSPSNEQRCMSAAPCPLRTIPLLNCRHQRPRYTFCVISTPAGIEDLLIKVVSALSPQSYPKPSEHVQPSASENKMFAFGV